MRILRFVAVAAALALLAAAETHAQTIGFKVGASFSNVSIDPDSDEGDPSTLTAFTGGGFLRFPLGSFYLQPELMYITKGFKLEDDASDAEASFKFSYIEVPVLLVLPLTRGARFTPYIFGGPALAMETGCKIGLEGGGASFSFDCDDDPEGEGGIDRKKVDIGAMAGLGFELPVGPGSLLVEGRYNFGLLNIADDDTADTSIKHRSGAVLVSYLMPLSR